MITPRQRGRDCCAESASLRKPTDDDIHIDIQLASGGAAGKSVSVRIEHAGQAQEYPLTVHQ